MGFFTTAQGFDEFMNVVLEDAEEVFVKDSKTHKAGERVSLGASCTFALPEQKRPAHVRTLNTTGKHLLLKGDNITLLQAAK